MQLFNLESYLTNGVETIMKQILKATIKNPLTSLFMVQYAKKNKKANEIRKNLEISGKHIPIFLIASITTKCNLHCKGCYARAANHCVDDPLDEIKGQLCAEQWFDVFRQAAELGISFIFLAGGEPLVRRDVLEMAALRKEILFPVFTNGTMLDDTYLTLFSKHKNLLPILSLEGDENTTNERRGAGVYQKIKNTMLFLHKREILFGVSVTVSKKNREEVLGDLFVQEMKEFGCKAVIYVEYVPMERETEALAIGEEEREHMLNRLNTLRETCGEMLFLAFPGDEKNMEGCLAAGRGFFHINAYGGAEPCPFFPYSDTNLKEVSLLEALDSPLFTTLKEDEILKKQHTGGCILFERGASNQHFKCTESMK